MNACLSHFAFRCSVVSSHPYPTLFRGGAFWFCLFSCCRRRRDSRHVAGCACPSQRRDSAPLWRVQPAHQVDGPGSFESTSTSCVPLDAPEPADEPAEKPACHARRSRESAEREKLGSPYGDVRAWSPLAPESKEDKGKISRC